MRNLCGLLILVIILGGCQKTNDDLTEITVALDWVPNTNHTGMYVAKELGYYEDNGLDVEFVQPQNGSAEQMVATNQADFAISSEENVYLARDHDLDVVAIEAIIAHNTSGFVSLADKNIKSPTDFSNRTYCGWGSEIESYEIKSVMEANGADPDYVEIVTTSDTIFNAPKDECDFFWVFEGWDIVKLQQEQIAYNYIPLIDYGIDEYTPVIITSDEMIDEQPKTVQAFVNANLRGYQYAIKQPDEAAEILTKQVPELEENFVFESQSYMSNVYKDKDSELGYMKPKIFEDFGQWLIDEEMIAEDTNLEDAYTNEFIENAKY